MKTNIFRALLFSTVLPLVPALAQMLDPSIDKKGEPFCYFSKPTDVLGVMDGREGTLLSPEGYLYTGWAELMFFTGNPPEPVSQRVKTLMKGYLPVVQYEFERQGIFYHVTAFAATLDGKPESMLVNFVRVKVENTTRSKRTAYFGAGIRYEGDATTDWGIADHRFGRPSKAAVPGEFEQAGTAFSREWEYAFADDAVLRDSMLIYQFQTAPVAPVRLMTLATGYNEKQTIAPAKLYVYPSTPVCVVNYPLALEPGQTQTLEFKMPYEPVRENTAEASLLRKASFDRMLEETRAFWEQIFARGLEITVPEEKAVNTFKASLVYDLIARNKVDSFYIQKVNEFQYDMFWLRDAAFILRMYDLSNYPDLARQCLDFFPRWQREDGNFLSQSGQMDGWGQALWAYGQHFMITRDTAFARTVFPSVKRAVAWLRAARDSDSLHLMPVTTPGDNEAITGHVTGHNFWALAGLKHAVALALALGEKESAAEFSSEYESLSSTLFRLLRAAAVKSHGAIPPGIDQAGGNDWDNMSSLYPEMLLAKDDPLVRGTLEATRAKYAEGLMTYDAGRYLHHYLTTNNMETELILGDQEHVIEEFYALLVHTSATHAGFEFAILPWSTRDFGMNLSPHGWFAAQFRTLMRMMMVREEGRDLHLLSCVSPEWIKNGKRIAVQRAPTNFGTLAFEYAITGRGATLTLDSRFTTAPEHLVLHIPWFVEPTRVLCDGKTLSIAQDGRSVILPSDAKKVSVTWRRNKNASELSYLKSVEAYKQEYRRRYEEFLKNGKQVY